MVQLRIEVLCDRHILERSKQLQWLVGSRFMPYTVISVLQCLHFNDQNGEDPDLTAETADIRILLPKGLEIVGAVLNEVANAEKAKKAGAFALKLATLVNSNDSSDLVSSNWIVACLEHGRSGLQFYNYSRVSGGIKVFEDVMYHDNPSAYLWSNMCLLHSELHLKVPVYAKSFSKPSDYKAQLLIAVKNDLDTLSSDKLFCVVDAPSGTKRTLMKAISKLGDVRLAEGEVNLGDQHMKLRCSDFSSPHLFTSGCGLQTPLPLSVTFAIHQSKKSDKNQAPFAEYLPVFEGAVLRVLNLKLAAVCLAPQQFVLHEAVTSLVLPAITDQLVSMRDTVLQEFVEQTKLCSYIFCPPGFIHPILCIYDVSYGESESRKVDHRLMLHRRLGLPMDRPLLCTANALSFSSGSDLKMQGTSRLCNVHINMPTSSEVVGGHCSIVQGSYEYYHYLQDNINDSGWGCAYRSLQTIISWFRLQHYTIIDVPTHSKIQEALVEIGDKEPSFKGSQNWIGAIELSFVLDKLLGVSSKILNVRSGAELPDKCRELAQHFETQGTPIMIGGGVLAYTLLGVDYNSTTGDCAFLILDPHYTGGEDLKSIWGGGWCGWKKPISSKGEEFFLRNKFYNLLLPQRPNTI